MKYFNSVLFKSICVLALIFMNQSCENEFSEIGTDIVGTPGFEIKKKTYPVTTYNKKITPFQSNGLAENLLGYYYDPVFGATTAKAAESAGLEINIAAPKPEAPSMTMALEQYIKKHSKK